MLASKELIYNLSFYCFKFHFLQEVCQMFQLVFYSAPPPSPPSKISRIYLYTLFLIMLITNPCDSSRSNHRKKMKNEVIHKPLKTRAPRANSSQDLLGENIKSY